MSGWSATLRRVGRDGDRTLRALVAAVGSGMLLALALPPQSYYALSFVALVPLFAVVATGTAGRAAAAGFVVGSVVYVGVFGGVATAVARVQARAIGAALMWFSAYTLYHAAQFALAAVAASWLLHALRRAHPGLGAAAVASVWVLLEWGFPKIFPWSVGAALGPAAWWRQAADLGGVYGLAAVVVAVNALLAGALLAAGERDWGGMRRGLGVAGAVLLGLSAYGWIAHGRGSEPSLVIALVQGNLPASGEDLVAGNERAFETYAALTEQLGEPAGLIVWPENVLRVYLSGNPFFRARVAAVVTRAGAPLLLGGLDQLGNGRGELNTAYLVSVSDGVAGAYHKRALVPFAEYVPSGLAWVVPAGWRTTGEFVAGDGARWLDVGRSAHPLPDLPPPGRGKESVDRVAMSICYEATLPGWFNGAVRDGAEVMVNLTDDGWFAGSRAPQAHLELTRLRAVETRRWLVRASNSGVSAIIDPSGEIVASLPFGAAGTLVRRVGLSDTLTPYVRWGDWVLLVCGAVLGIAGVVAIRRLST